MTHRKLEPGQLGGIDGWAKAAVSAGSQIMGKSWLGILVRESQEKASLYTSLKMFKNLLHLEEDKQFLQCYAFEEKREERIWKEIEGRRCDFERLTMSLKE